MLSWWAIGGCIVGIFRQKLSSARGARDTASVDVTDCVLEVWRAAPFALLLGMQSGVSD